MTNNEIQRLVDQPTLDWLIDWWIDTRYTWLVDWLIDKRYNWLIDWLIDTYHVPATQGNRHDAILERYRKFFRNIVITNAVKIEKKNTYRSVEEYVKRKCLHQTCFRRRGKTCSPSATYRCTPLHYSVDISTDHISRKYPQGQRSATFWRILPAVRGSCSCSRTTRLISFFLPRNFSPLFPAVRCTNNDRERRNRGDTWRPCRKSGPESRWFGQPKVQQKSRREKQISKRKSKKNDFYQNLFVFIHFKSYYVKSIIIRCLFSIWFFVWIDYLQKFW